MRTLSALCLFALVISSPRALAHNHDDAKGDHQVAHDHKHEHNKKCGHKAEKHGDHTDFEETVDGKTHHHHKHDKHYDECEGPEAEAGAKKDAGKKEEAHH